MQKLEWYSEEEDVQMCFTKGKDMVSTYMLHSLFFSCIAFDIAGAAIVIVPYYRIRSSMNFAFYSATGTGALIILCWWNPSGHFCVSELDEWFTCQCCRNFFMDAARLWVQELYEA